MEKLLTPLSTTKQTVKEAPQVIFVLYPPNMIIRKFSKNHLINHFATAQLLMLALILYVQNFTPCRGFFLYGVFFVLSANY